MNINVIIIVLAALVLFVVIAAAVRNYNANRDARICPFCDSTFAGSFCRHCGCPKHEGYEL